MEHQVLLLKKSLHLLFRLPSSRLSVPLLLIASIVCFRYCKGRYSLLPAFYTKSTFFQTESGVKASLVGHKHGLMLPVYPPLHRPRSCLMSLCSQITSASLSHTFRSFLPPPEKKKYFCLFVKSIG